MFYSQFYVFTSDEFSSNKFRFKHTHVSDIFTQSFLFLCFLTFTFFWRMKLRSKFFLDLSPGKLWYYRLVLAPEEMVHKVTNHTFHYAHSFPEHLFHDA